jgi:hypothetical protein
LSSISVPGKAFQQGGGALAPSARRSRQVGRLGRLAGHRAERGAVVAHLGDRHRQEMVEVAERPAAHDGQRPVQPGGEALQEARQAGLHLHRIRARRNLDQGAVEVEEERRVRDRAGVRRQRRGREGKGPGHAAAP